MTNCAERQPPAPMTGRAGEGRAGMPKKGSA
jgi:hypothetical protein